ncbi:MAG: uroporphyrinogen-III C-methyltransferase [Verrucomicrobiae bacterium]|nr:uroporphyrinogen-III C-methyltransferase [Verrucomicrobiae bacterium]
MWDGDRVASVSSQSADGIVYLVGAGPGDPGLLTCRGAELLGRASVVVYDALVNADLLRLAPASAERIYAGKRSRDHAVPQADLNRLLVDRARAGGVVVRLKGGDPYTFGRGAEEAAELAAAGVAFEVVPGISSVTAAPNYAGIPLTHREHCSSFHVFTGHEDPGKPESRLDWGQIAQLNGTRVILMGIERLGDITAGLLTHGAAAGTPVALVRWGTTGRQETLVGTLADIAARAATAGFAAPAVIVIGDVVTLRGTLDWFERRPLFGQRIVVTRTREQASDLRRQLAELGAEVLEIPTIRIEPPEALGPLVEAIAGLGEYNWLVFTSPNGVTAFFDYFFKAYDDVRALGMARIAAVGPATAARLRELHLAVDAMPQEYVASRVAAAIGEKESIENLRILCLRAEVANPDLVARLEEAGGIVDDVACYRTVPETADANGAVARFEEDGADWITFTSASTVENFHARFDLPAVCARRPGLRLASIGPETTRAVTALGLQPAVEARPHNLAGLIQGLRSAVRRSRLAASKSGKAHAEPKPEGHGEEA